MLYDTQPVYKNKVTTRYRESECVYIYKEALIMNPVTFCVHTITTVTPTVDQLLTVIPTSRDSPPTYIKLYYSQCTVQYKVTTHLQPKTPYLVYNRYYYRPVDEDLLVYCPDACTQDILPGRIQAHRTSISIDACDTRSTLVEWHEAYLKWSTWNICSYQYQIRWSMYRPSNPTTTVVVKDGTVDTYYWSDGHTRNHHPGTTLDELFDQLFVWVADTRRCKVTLAYNATYGYPQYATLDRACDVADEEVHLEVLSFHRAAESESKEQQSVFPTTVEKDPAPTKTYILTGIVFLAASLVITVAITTHQLSARSLIRLGIVYCLASIATTTGFIVKNQS